MFEQSEYWRFHLKIALHSTLPAILSMFRKWNYIDTIMLMMMSQRENLLHTLKYLNNITSLTYLLCVYMAFASHNSSRHHNLHSFMCFSHLLFPLKCCVCHSSATMSKMPENIKLLLRASTESTLPQPTSFPLWNSQRRISFHTENCFSCLQSSWERKGGRWMGKEIA